MDGVKSPFLLLLALGAPSSAVADPCTEILRTQPQTQSQPPLEARHPSREEALRLLELRSQPLRTRVLYASPQHGDAVEVIGVPSSARLVEYGPSEVFRYYVSDRALYDRIVSERTLRAGNLPYVVVHPQLRREYYYSLEGIFLTKPAFRPEQVGLERDPRMSYVDFTLPEGLGLIQLEPGIFLVPGKPAVRDWIREAYERYRASGATAYPPGYEDAFRNIERSQGKGDATFRFNPI